MESKSCPGICDRSSGNSLRYRRDAYGKIQWDFVGQDSEEQCSEDFDEPDGDISNVCLHGKTDMSGDIRQISKVNSPVTLLSNRENGSQFICSTTTGNAESSQPTNSFRDQRAVHWANGRPAQSASPTVQPIQSPSRIPVRKPEHSGGTRPQYSPLTPPATPKKSPRNYGSLIEGPLLPSPSHARDTSKFSFQDEVCDEPARLNSSPSKSFHMRYVPSSPRCTGRDKSSVVFPLPPESCIPKSPGAGPYAGDMNMNRASLLKLRYEEDDMRFKPLALQDPPKHKKKSVTWQDGSLQDHRQHHMQSDRFLLGYQGNADVCQAGLHEPSTGIGIDASDERDITLPQQLMQPNNEYDSGSSFPQLIEQRYNENASCSPKQTVNTSPRKRRYDMEDRLSDVSPNKLTYPMPSNKEDNISSNSRSVSGLGFPSVDRVQQSEHIYTILKNVLFQQDLSGDLNENTECSTDTVREGAIVNQLKSLLHSRFYQGSNRMVDSTSPQRCPSQRPEYTQQHRINSQQSIYLNRNQTYPLFSSSDIQGVPTLPSSPFRVPSSPSTRQSSILCSPSRKRSPASTTCQFFFPSNDSPNKRPSSPVSVHMPPSSPGSTHARSTFNVPGSPKGDNFCSGIAKSSPPTAGYSRLSPSGCGRSPSNGNRSPSEGFKSARHFMHDEAVSKYPRCFAPPVDNPWHFPPNNQNVPNERRGNSAAKRRLFNCTNDTLTSSTKETDTSSTRSNLMFEHIASTRNRHIVPSRPLSSSMSVNSVFNNDYRGAENQAEPDVMAYVNDQKRMLRLRGHSMGEIEESMIPRELLRQQYFNRSQSLPISPQLTAIPSDQYNACDRQRSRGNIDIRVECDDIIEQNHQLAEDLRELRTPSESKSCDCTDVEDQILQMTRNAYNIRRLDDSPEAFARFENEVHQTNEDIADALRILRALKKLCGHGRSINDIYTGSIIFSLQCHSVESLQELWSWYQTGELQQMLQDGLITESLMSKCNATNISLKVTIEEHEFLECLDSFDCFEDNYERLLVVNSENTAKPMHQAESQCRFSQEADSSYRENQKFLYTRTDRELYKSGMLAASLAYRQKPISPNMTADRSAPSPMKSINMTPHKPTNIRVNMETMLIGYSEIDELVSPTRKAFQELKYN